MALECFDLKPWAERRRYRWKWEESRQMGDDDPYFIEILCKYGMIYPMGGDTLLAYANEGIKRHLVKMGVDHHQYDGNNEVFRFPVAKLDEVAAVIKPKKRRTLDPDRARALGKGTQYGAQSHLEKK